MAHIRTDKTQPKPYEVRWSWYNGQGKRHFAKQRFAKKEQALSKKREVEQAAADGADPNPQPGKETFTAWAERWYRSKEPANKSSTMRGYRSILDHTVLPAFGQRKVRAITTGDVEDFKLALLASGKSAPTVRHHLLVLRQVLAYAALNKAIAVSPGVGVPMPSDHRPRVQRVTLDQAEVDRLADAFEEETYGLMIRFMAYTGLRAGEVAGLEIGDLQLLGVSPHVVVRRTRRKVRGGWEESTPKNGKTRKVPIPGWLRDDLAAYLAGHPHRDDRNHPLWPGRTNGGQNRFRHDVGSLDFTKPWERDTFYKRHFKPALAAAGLDESMRLHDLRHTAGSIMLSNGIPPYRVAAYLGHSMEVLLGIYAHLLSEDTADDMARLDRRTTSKRRA